MPNNWINALKIFNEGKNEWCIPKKGGKEYEEIKKIMNGETIQIAPKPPKPIKQPKQPKAPKEQKAPKQPKAPKEPKQPIEQDKNIYATKIQSAVRNKIARKILLRQKQEKQQILTEQPKPLTIGKKKIISTDYLNF